MSRRTVRLVAVSYGVKTLLLALLWVVAPEVPARALGHARAAWALGQQLRMPELSGVKIVRSIADFDSAMPQFIKTFLEDALAGRPL